MPILMDDAERRRFLTEATAARERVEAALAGLIRDRDAIEKELQEGRRADLFKHVTGKSSLDRAVDDPERTVCHAPRHGSLVSVNGIRPVLDNRAGDVTATCRRAAAAVSRRHSWCPSAAEQFRDR